MAREIIIKIKLPESDFFDWPRRLYRKIKNFVGAITAHYWQCISQDTKSRPKQSWLIISAVLIVAYFNVGTALLCLIFLSFLTYGWNSRPIITVALLMLVISPLLLLIKKEIAADLVVSQAYYLLLIFIALHIIRLRQDYNVTTDDSMPKSSEAVGEDLWNKKKKNGASDSLLQFMVFGWHLTSQTFKKIFYKNEK